MEWLDEVDESGQPTGRVFERSYMHEKGIRHRTSHVWILRWRPEGLQILLQKRSEEKDSFPGDYDISSAGHIPAGQDFGESAIRELEEELGIKTQEENLLPAGMLAINNKLEFHGKPFLDSQICRVYGLFLDIEPEQMKLQASEVDSVMWISLEDCLRRTRAGEFPCLLQDELELLIRVFST